MPEHMIELEPSRYFRIPRPKDSRPIRKALPFVESLIGQYTHRVRNATIHTSKGKSHISVGCWCGLSFYVSPRKKTRLVAIPGEGRPLCGTCEGRVIGAGKTDSRMVGAHELRFRPRPAPEQGMNP